jgi:hypothetical protein
MKNFVATRAKWTMSIVSLIFACVCFYAVRNSEKKALIVSLTFAGTASLITAIRECPLPFARYSSMFVGAIILTLAILLICSGLGYYNHSLKIVIVIVLFSGAGFFLWNSLKDRSTPD